jgi:hypothetical protein
MAEKDEGNTGTAFQPGLGPTNKNILKIFVNSCQIFRFLKLLTNISD